MLRLVIFLCCCTLCAAQAHGQIRKWGGDGSDYVISQQERTIRIFGTGTYKFEAVSAGSLTDISWIRVYPAVNGTVTVYVARDPEQGTGPGARDVQEVDLSGASNGVLAELLISADYGELGPMRVASAGVLTIGGAVLNDIIVEDAITGDITITGLLEADISCDAMEDLTVVAGTVNAPTITIRGPYADFIYIQNDSVPGTLGRLEVQGELSGTVRILNNLGGGEIAGDLMGAIHVGAHLTGNLDLFGDLGSGPGLGALLIYGGQYGNVHLTGTLRGALFAGGVAGDITIDGSVAPGASIEANSGISGNVQVGADMSGIIQVIGEAGVTGDVYVGGNLAGVFEVLPRPLNPEDPANLYGSLEIGRNLSGLISVQKELWDVNQDLSGGHIIINGAFESSGRIELGIGLHGATEFICVDYDGYNSSDWWDPNACVRIGLEPPYEHFCGNTPAKRLWRVQCSKGDLTNDGTVDDFDIDPFVLALSDPPAYARAFPGMSGSREYHGNCNCQGGFDNFDIDAFTLRLTDWETYRCVYPGCDPCLGPCSGGGEGLGAQAVGELYKKSVAPERLPYVVDTAEFLAGWYKGAPRGKFWAEVHAALVK